MIIPRYLYGLLLLVAVSCSTQKKAASSVDNNELRIMSYNIHHANPPSREGVIDVDAIAAVINKEKPDVVAVQEVDINTKRSGLNEAALLARKTHMNFHFARAIDYDGGQYGVLILSRFPLSEGKTYPLPTAAGTNGEPRVLATATIYLNGRGLTIACTHMDAQRNDTNRLLQIRAIDSLLQKDHQPVILAGDLNAAPGSEVINILDRHFTRTCVENCGFTIPVEKPTKTIDFIAFKPAATFTVKEHRVIDEKYASDHLPVMATLQLK